jgi:sulfur relay (sulfurtransferase) DsrC/TusE family protein
VESNDANFIRGLYINSDYKFGPASDEVEEALNSFLSELKKAQRNNFRRRKRHIQLNLTPPLWKLMLFLRRHDLYIVISADKNLGPCIMDRVIYIRKGCSEHLGNGRQYKILTAQEAKTKMTELHYKLSEFRTEFHYKPKLDMQKGLRPKVTPISDAEDTFLLRAVKRNPAKLARFRMTYKIHKDPPKMRPIVCCSGTFMNDWSKWLDYQLQKLKPFVSSYLRDTQQLLDEMKQLEQLPYRGCQICHERHYAKQHIRVGRPTFLATYWHSNGHIRSSHVGHNLLCLSRRETYPTEIQTQSTLLSALYRRCFCNLAHG